MPGAHNRNAGLRERGDISTYIKHERRIINLSQSGRIRWTILRYELYPCRFTAQLVWAIPRPRARSVTR